MLSVQNLSVKYDLSGESYALRDVGFSIKEGERVALIGQNGAGKSTLLLTLAGVLSPVSGEVLVDGIKLEKKTRDAVRRKIGMVFQNPDDQLFMPTVYEDVAFGPRSCGLPEETTLDLAVRALETLEVAHLKGRLATGLSGGEKRLIALAGVLVTGPSVLFMDEPSSFLDPRARRRLIGVLGSLPKAMLIATHDLDLALDLCERVILLQNGQIRADAPAGLILRDAALLCDCGLELPLSLAGQEK